MAGFEKFCLKLIKTLEFLGTSSLIPSTSLYWGFALGLHWGTFVPHIRLPDFGILHCFASQN